MRFLSKLSSMGCSLLAGTLAAGEIRTVTEDEVLELLEKSPVALSLARELERAHAETGRQGLWPDPDLLISREDAAGVTDQFFTVQQTLPVSGRLGLGRDAAESAAKAVGQRLQLGRLALRAEARSAFYELLAAQQRSMVLEEGRDRVADLVRILRIREQTGESSGFDRMRSERELAEVEVDFVEARRDEDRARSNLRGLLALEPGVELVAEGRLEEEWDVPSLERLQARAESRGDVASFELERQSAERRGQAASRLWIPEPGFQLGMKKTEARDVSGRGWVFSFNFAVPVFNRGQRDVALAQADQSLARTRYEARLHLARAEIESAHQEVLRFREAEDLYRSAADPDELVRVARIAYDEGEQGILELLDAYRTALEVRLRRLDLATGSRGATIRLNLALGEEVIP